MKLSRIKWPTILIVAGVIGLVCLLEFRPVDFLTRVENYSADSRMRMVAKLAPPVSTNLAWVTIGESSIKAVNDGSVGFHYGLYWPRHLYGRVALELQLRGALAVAFDVMFGDLRPDHASMVFAENDESIKSDDLFALDLKRAGNVILGSEHNVIPHPLFRTNALALGDISADKDLDGILRRAKVFQIYHDWNRIFQAIADQGGVDLEKFHLETNSIVFERDPDVGPLVVNLDKDGNFDATDLLNRVPKGMPRHMKPFTDTRVWHMGIVLAARQLKLDLENPVIELDRGRITLHGPNGISRVIPIDKDGYFTIDWRITANNRQVPKTPFENLLAQYQVRTGEKRASAIKLAEDPQYQDDWTNKLVVVGSTAEGNDLTDRGATPLEKDTVLVLKHLNVANQLLTNQFVHASSRLTGAGLIILLGIIAACLVLSLRPYAASIWMLVTLAFFLAVAFFAAIKYEYWMPVVLPMGGGILTHVCLLTYLIVFEQQDKRRVKSVFAKMVSPDVVTELLDMPTLAIEGARRKVTILFADIRGFTEMTDVHQKRADDYVRANNLSGAAADAVFTAQAQETLNTVNSYLKIIADEVLKQKGTVDKFIGDCVMAFWGAPVPNEQHALFCVHAAIAAQRAIYHVNLKQAEENQRREAENIKLAAAGKPLMPILPLLVLGSGINTGVVNVGLMGSDQQMNYTVFGREVNLASRLETVSGRARIIISEATLADLIRYDATLASSCIERESVHVKGIADAVKIYEVPWREVDVTVPSSEFKPVEPAGSFNTGYFTKADVG